MATSQNPLSSQEQELREQVRLLDEQALKWQNILSLKGQIKKAAKEERDLRSEVVKLGVEEARNAVKAKDATQAIKTYEKELQQQKAAGNRRAVTQLVKDIAFEKQALKDLNKTRGGALMIMSMEAKKRKDNLTAERNLIKDINKERGLGSKITDLFRSKEERQRQIDIARAKSGGGANLPPGGVPPTTTSPSSGADTPGGNLKGAGVVGAVVASMYTLATGVKNTVVALGKVLLTSLLGPLKEVSALVGGGIGGGYGVGGGSISGTGATSILGGFQEIASKIPFIGGLLGGLIGALKGVVDLVLGLDQGITNFARNLGISKDQAKGIKEEFIGIRNSSDSVVINETRLMESQVELTKALGIRSRFSADILKNNVELKEVAGLELETRKAIAQLSITQNKSATQLTKNIAAQSKAFEFQTGVAFEYRQVLSEATKQAGLLGLSFTKYPEKLTRALLTTKAMGYELKQLDSIANSFLDFESSISKEMEAQVLTGREMNLTRAREAALNNDLVGLAKEINKNVGSTADYLNLNRIQQDAIAESVGMTRDGLSEVLKQQEYYQKLGATNLKQAQEQLRVLKQQGLTQAEISKKIGEDAYNYITQTSTAERLSEVMNRIKNTFVEFVEKSGILDFITNPQKIQAFAQALIDRLAGAVELLGNLMASLAGVVGRVAGVFGGDRTQWDMLSDKIRGGTSNFAGGLRQTGATLGGALAPSIGTTVQNGVRPRTTETPVGISPTSPQSTLPQQQGNVYLDGLKVGQIIYNQVGTQVYGVNK